VPSPHPSQRLISPVSGATATQTRIDQGVDWSSIRGNIVTVGSGVIAAVYGSLQGFGYTIVERLGGGRYVYYGLETGGTPIGVQPGQAVAAGTPVATGRGAGGIEVGYWDPSTGRPVGAPGYTEGRVTAAGTQFAQDISRGGTGTGVGPSTPGMGGQQSTLAQLWIQAGGKPGLANLMAAIAMAESGGKVDAEGSNANGTTDNGLWQINSSHTQYDIARLRSDPLYNAQAAVAIEKSEGLKAWTTYTSGAYKAFLSTASRATYTLTRPGGEAVGAKPASGVPQVFDQYVSLRDMPRTAPPNTSNPFQWFLASFTGDWSKVAASAGAPTTPPSQ